MSDPSKPDPNSLAERWQQSQETKGHAGRDDMNHGDHPNSPADAETPARCPACRSADVKTTSKVASVDNYWRCGDCGEVWNVGRQRAGSRYGDNRPFRR